MDNFGFPSNIKQIGNVDSNMRIYIEDNVYTYLLKYAECNKNKESLAMLVGRCMLVEGEEVLFINGAIEGKHTYIKKGLMAFSEQSLKHIEEQKDTYFKGLEIVGWMISQPCFGNFLSGGYAKYHTDNFQKRYQVLFVTDPVEKVHSFFSYDKSTNDIVESGGFFIYYDKNKDMENYVANNEIKEFSIQETVEVEEDVESFQDTLVEEVEKVKKEDKGIIKIFNVSDKNNDQQFEKDVQNIKYDSKNNNKQNSKVKPKVVVERKKRIDNVQISKKKLQEKAIERERKKTQSMYTAVSFLLAMLTFALGTNLLQNSKKLDSITAELNEVKLSYNLLQRYIDTQKPIESLASNDVEPESVQASGTTMVLKDFGDEDEVTDNTIENASSYNNSSSINNNSNITKEIQEVVQQKPTIIPDTYVVESGDSLLNISLTYYGNESKVVEIMELNEIANPDKIYIGMVLRLP